MRRLYSSAARSIPRWAIWDGRASESVLQCQTRISLSSGQTRIQAGHSPIDERRRLHYLSFSAMQSILLKQIQLDSFQSFLPSLPQIPPIRQLSSPSRDHSVQMSTATRLRRTLSSRGRSIRESSLRWAMRILEATSRIQTYNNMR